MGESRASSEADLGGGSKMVGGGGLFKTGGGGLNTVQTHMWYVIVMSSMTGPTSSPYMNSTDTSSFPHTIVIGFSAWSPFELELVEEEVKLIEGFNRRKQPHRL